MHGFKKKRKNKYVKLIYKRSALDECFVAVIYYGEKNNTIAGV